MKGICRSYLLVGMMMLGSHFLQAQGVAKGDSVLEKNIQKAFREYPSFLFEKKESAFVLMRLFFEGKDVRVKVVNDNREEMKDFVESCIKKSDLKGKKGDEYLVPLFFVDPESDSLDGAAIEAEWKRNAVVENVKMLRPVYITAGGHEASCSLKTTGSR